MSKHTPGPWKVFPARHPGIDSGTASDDCPIIVFSDEGPDDDDAGVRGRDASEIRANARLIAAAPELLEACLAAETCVGELSPTQARVEVMQMIQAALQSAGVREDD